MTVAELLIACKDGNMPEVQTKEPIKGAKSTVGKVVVIKQGTTHSGFFGCAVQFPGLAWDTWFTEGYSPDKRGHYMNELTLKT